MNTSRSIILLPVLLLLVGACAAPTASANASGPAAITIAYGAIPLPSGWDDEVIDRIKNNQPLKKVLAVLDFEGNEILAGKVDLKMADMLTTSIVKSGRFDVVERNKIDRVLGEQDLGLTGILDEASAAQMGKLLGAEYVVFGSITSATKKNVDKFGYMLVVIEVGVDVRAVNTTDGKILLSESAVGISESKVVTTADGTVVSGAIDYNSAYADAARDAVQKVGSRIADLAPLLGFVVAVSGDEIIIDVGEEQGIKVGDRFVVFNVLGEILHPATGKHLGWTKNILAEIVVRSTEKIMSTGAITARKSETSNDPAVGDYAISR